MKVLSSQAVTLSAPFWFVICRVERNLDRVQWRTLLTIACPHHHQIVPHIGQLNAVVGMGL